MGGIDLTTDILPLETRGEGMSSSPINFPDWQNIDPAMISGIEPFIIQITPVTDLPMFLGVKDENEYELQQLGAL